MREVCVVGSVNLDVLVRVEAYPGPGETVLGNPVGRLPGGKGFNQAVAAHRAGARVRFCGQVGDDADGRRLRAALVEAGLDDGSLGVDASLPTGVAYVTARGHENRIVVAPGANAGLPADAASAAAARAHVVLVQLEIPALTAEAALAAGRRAGALTVLNAAPVADTVRSLVRLTDVLVVNESESAALGGVDSLLRSGPGAVVVTLGAAGSVWIDTSGAIEMQAFAVDAIDTTGSGDAFCGVLAASIAAGLPKEAALRRASAAGAIVATAVGAQTDLLGRRSIDDLVGA